MEDIDALSDFWTHKLRVAQTTLNDFRMLMEEAAEKNWNDHSVRIARGILEDAVQDAFKEKVQSENVSRKYASMMGSKPKVRQTYRGLNLAAGGAYTDDMMRKLQEGSLNMTDAQSVVDAIDMMYDEAKADTKKLFHSDPRIKELAYEFENKLRIKAEAANRAKKTIQAREQRQREDDMRSQKMAERREAERRESERREAQRIQQMLEMKSPEEIRDDWLSRAETRLAHRRIAQRKFPEFKGGLRRSPRLELLQK